MCGQQDTVDTYAVTACACTADISRPSPECVVVVRLMKYPFAHEGMPTVLAFAATYVQRLASSDNSLLQMHARRLMGAHNLVCMLGRTGENANTYETTLTVYLTCVLIASKAIGHYYAVLPLSALLSGFGVAPKNTPRGMEIEVEVAMALGWRFGPRMLG